MFFGSLALPLLLTIPRRYGLAIAITYLIRKRWPDPKDTFPSDRRLTDRGHANLGHRSLIAQRGTEDKRGGRRSAPM